MKRKVQTIILIVGIIMLAIGMGIFLASRTTRSKSQKNTIVDTKEEVLAYIKNFNTGDSCDYQYKETEEKNQIVYECMASENVKKVYTFDIKNQELTSSSIFIQKIGS